jgi:hypothetical protein
MKKIAKVTLPASWLETEKGNTMVARDDGGIAAWIHIKKDIYLEITDTPGNSPRLSVTFIEATPAKLKKAIREQCAGWFCVRWNADKNPPITEESSIS